jgi:hypothetical protein
MSAEIAGRLQPVRQKALRPEGYNHFGNGHFYFWAGPCCLPQFPFKFGQLPVMRRAVKATIAIAAAPALKGFTPRAAKRTLSGSLQFMRNSMQPADHGTMGVHAAAALQIQRTHGPVADTVFSNRILPARLCGSPLYSQPDNGVKLTDALLQEKIFHIRMVVKSTAAAVFFAAAANEPQLVGDQAVSVVHGSIYFNQRFSERDEGPAEAFGFG